MIKIKLAIIDDDINYAERLRVALNTKYANSIELYFFDSIEKFVKKSSDIKVNVILLNEYFDENNLSKLKNVAIGYLCTSNDITTINEKIAISKFQKLDDFYKKILNLYSESIAGSISINSDENNSIVLFSSAAGGVGTSTLALAYAKRLAEQGKKPLYLNLELFGDVSNYFDNSDSQNFSDIIYALKSKKANVPIKMQSCIETSNQGIYYFNSCSIPLHLLEMNDEDYKTLIFELKRLQNYDTIIIDTDLTLSRRYFSFMNNARKIVIVSDGSDSANLKTTKLFDTLSLLADQGDINDLDKIDLFYNKFSSRTSSQIANRAHIGGVQKYEGFAQSEIINKISLVSELDKI